MKDIDKAATLLSELGIGFNRGKSSYDGRPNVTQSVKCREGMGKVEGYCGSITEFYFDADGGFICMGIWE